MTTRRYSNRAIYRQLLQEGRPYWPHITGLFFPSLLSSPIALLIRLPLRLVVDNVIGSQPDRVKGIDRYQVRRSACEALPIST